mmetsp:Transcript_45093/g.113572  ORF Transcript_45093/g.113572 Transcript_45093/m.113572 type:complete len:100 (+) Transcript_45093:674-973(+)
MKKEKKKGGKPTLVTSLFGDNIALALVENPEDMAHVIGSNPVEARCEQLQDVPRYSEHETDGLTLFVSSVEVSQSNVRLHCVRRRWRRANAPHVARKIA